MKKIIKFIFGRFFITSLLVIIQFALLVAAFVYLDVVSPYFYFVNLGFSIAGIIMVLVLMGRQSNPNYILPWIIIILVMPPLGVALYILFSQNRLRRREKKLYRKLHGLNAEYAPQSKRVADALADKDAVASGQSKYLYYANNLPVYDNSYCKYFPSGEGFFAALKEELKKAERFIFLEFFIVEKGMMWNSVLDILTQKVEQGVEVRFMYDDIGSIGRVKAGYYKQLRKLGIKCVKFNKFLPIVSAMHNNRDHRKIAVIDGKTAFVCGANLADEYINVIKKYGYWKDSAVMLRGEAVKSITLMFLQLYGAQTKTCEDFSPYLPDCASQGKAHGFVQPFGDGPLPLYSENVGKTAILNMINQAERYVYITTPYLIVDYQLTEALKCAAKRGVDIKIITPRIADKKLVFMMTRSSYHGLIKCGVKIYEYLPGFMHSKNYVADDRVAIVGTMNMDYRSLVHHFECGVWMYDTPCISEIRQDFCQSLSASHQVTPEEARLNPFQKLVRLVLGLFAPLL